MVTCDPLGYFIMMAATQPPHILLYFICQVQLNDDVGIYVYVFEGGEYESGGSYLSCLPASSVLS